MAQYGTVVSMFEREVTSLPTPRRASRNRTRCQRRHTTRRDHVNRRACQCTSHLGATPTRRATPPYLARAYVARAYVARACVARACVARAYTTRRDTRHVVPAFLPLYGRGSSAPSVSFYASVAPVETLDCSSYI